MTRTNFQTSLCNTAIDNPTHRSQERFIESILDFLDTDTILWVARNSCALTRAWPTEPRLASSWLTGINSTNRKNSTRCSSFAGNRSLITSTPSEWVETKLGTANRHVSDAVLRLSHEPPQFNPTLNFVCLPWKSRGWMRVTAFAGMKCESVRRLASECQTFQTQIRTRCDSIWNLTASGHSRVSCAMYYVHETQTLSHYLVFVPVESCL